MDPPARELARAGPGNSVPAFATRFIPALARCLARAGLDPAAISPDFAPRREGGHAEDPTTATLTTQRIRELADAAERALRDPFVGLRAVALVPRGGYGVLEYAARNAPDLRGAVERSVRYHRLINGVVTISLTSRDEGVVALEHLFRGDPLGVGRHGHEFASAMLLRVMRDAAGPGNRAAPRRVWFAHERPQPVGELKDYFGTVNVEFGRETNGMLFGPEVLDTSLPEADGALLPILDRHAAMLLPAAPPPVDLLEEIREQVKRGLKDGASVGVTARALRMSVRTLQRRLAERGTSYRSLLDAVREEAALEYVEGARPLAEIAFLLGYSDTRAFIRAFRRWTGVSPLRHRREHAPRGSRRFVRERYGLAPVTT